MNQKFIKERFITACLQFQVSLSTVLEVVANRGNAFWAEGEHLGAIVLVATGQKWKKG